MKKYLSLSAVVFLVMVAALSPLGAVAQETVSPPQLKSPVNGGPNAVPIKTIVSINSLLGAVTHNTGQLVKGIAGMIDQNSGTNDVANKVKTAIAGYNGAEERRTGNMAGGTVQLQMFRPTMSLVTAMVLSQFIATSGGEGETQRQFLDAFKQTPGNLTRKEYGGGGTSKEADALVRDLCAFGGLHKDTAQVIAKTPQYAGCMSDPEIAGCTSRMSVLESQYEGIKVKKGEKTAKCVQALYRIADFGASISAKMARYNTKDINEMLVAEARDLENQKHYAQGEMKMTPAVFNLSDNKQNKLFMRTSNEAEIADSVAAYLAREFAGGVVKDQMGRCLVFNASTINTGADIYKNQKASYTKQTGSAPCVANGFRASTHCEAKMAGAGYRRAGAASTTEAQQPGQMNANVLTASNSVEAAKNRSSSRGDCAVAAESIKGNYTQLAAVLASPVFQAFLANMDEKYIKEANAESKERMRDNDIQLALNIEDSFRRMAGVSYFAANDPRVKKKPEQMMVADVFDAAGVDMASLMPVNGGGRKIAMYAALLPTLNDQLGDPTGLSQFAAKTDKSGLLPGMRFVMNYDGRALSQFAAADAAPAPAAAR